ncbi:hypothetical protein RCL1_007763 [Eukaryota sp. TZLM3-RCL]
MLQVSTGRFHVLFLYKSTVHALGSNFFGQCGFSVTPTTSVLNYVYQIVDLSSVARVFAIHNTSFAIDDVGQVYAWGSLVRSLFSNDAGMCCSSPQQLPLLNIIEVSGGHDYFLFLNSSGQVSGIGCNTSNQLNFHIREQCISSIVMLSGLNNIIKISDCAAIDNLGKVFVWGTTAALLGKGLDLIQLDLPFSCQSVVVFENSVIVHTTSGLVYRISVDEITQLNSLPATFITSGYGQFFAQYSDYEPQYKTMNFGSGFAFAIGQDDSLYSKGRNLGQFDSIVSSSSFIRVENLFDLSLAQEKDVSSNSLVTCSSCCDSDLVAHNLLKTTLTHSDNRGFVIFQGKLLSFSKLGHSSVCEEFFHYQLDSLNSFISENYLPLSDSFVFDHVSSSHLFTSLVSDEGSVFIDGKFHLIEVPGFTRNLVKLTNVVSTSCGLYHLILLTSSGEVFATGCNSLLQLGSVFPIETHSLVKVPVSKCCFICSSDFHSFALSCEGDVFSWGCNFFGQSCPFETDDFILPTHVVSNVKLISTCRCLTLFLTNCNKLSCFGTNSINDLNTTEGIWKRDDRKDHIVELLVKDFDVSFVQQICVSTTALALLLTTGVVWLLTEFSPIQRLYFTDVTSISLSDDYLILSTVSSIFISRIQTNLSFKEISTPKLSESNPEDICPVDKFLNPPEIFSSWLKKQGGFFKTWKKRFFILRPNFISYHENSDSPPLGFLNLRKDSIISKITQDYADKLQLKTKTIQLGFLFQSSPGDRIYVIRAQDINLQEQWMSHITKAINNL